LPELWNEKLEAVKSNPMQKWEYMSMTERQGHPGEFLDQLGEKGWELVTVIEDDGVKRFFFKRPKQ
jgi:hypothetical protein